MALKYKKILYCTDFSEDADYAFLTALDMARKYRAQLYIFHVVHSPYKYIPSMNRWGKGKRPLSLVKS